MNLIVLDTDILSLYQRGDRVITSRANAHPPGGSGNHGRSRTRGLVQHASKGA